MMEWAAGAASFDSGAAARPPLMWGAAGARAWVGRCPAARCSGCRDGVEPPRWRGPPATAEERRGGAWRPGRSGVVCAAHPGEGSGRRVPSATGGAAARPDPGDSNTQQPGAPRASSAAVVAHQAAVGEAHEEGGAAAAHGRRRRGRRCDGAADQRDPHADPTRALPPAEIDLPGGGAAAAAEA